MSGPSQVTFYMVFPKLDHLKKLGQKCFGTHAKNLMMFKSAKEYHVWLVSSKECLKKYINDCINSSQKMLWSKLGENSNFRKMLPNSNQFL